PEGGVVDEDVDRAEPRARVRHELRARARIEDVTPDRDGTAAVGLDRLDGLAERPGHAVRGAIEAPRHGGDVCTLGREALCDRGADPAARAGDDRNPALAFSAHARLLMPG